MANEKRVRAGGVAGALSSGLAIAGTSMSSAGLADLPAVDTTNHAALTLFTTDSNGRVTKREIVYVTAHTAAATTATIVKAQEGTTDQAWSTGDKWVHAPTARDYPKIKYAARTAGSVTLNATAYTAVDTGIDLTVTAAAGDVLQISVGFSIGPSVAGTSTYVFFDVLTLDGSNYASGAGASGEGIQSLYCGPENNNFQGRAGIALYTVQAGDVASGNIRLRLMYRMVNAANRSLSATSTDPLQFGVVNHGPQQA